MWSDPLTHFPLLNLSQEEILSRMRISASVCKRLQLIGRFLSGLIEEQLPAFGKVRKRKRGKLPQGNRSLKKLGGHRSSTFTEFHNFRRYRTSFTVTPHTVSVR
jgi:hypothetical protein